MYIHEHTHVKKLWLNNQEPSSRQQPWKPQLSQALPANTGATQPNSSLHLIITKHGKRFVFVWGISIYIYILLILLIITIIIMNYEGYPQRLIIN